MKIGIDISRANTNKRTGVESYVFHIFTALQEIVEKKRTDITLLGYLRETAVSDIPSQNKTMLKVLGWPPKFFWTLVRLSAELFIHPIDALFVPGHVLPLYSPSKTVLFVHDVAAARFPEAFSFFERWYSLWSVRYAIKKEATILVPSACTKNEILAIFPESNNANIHVVPHGISKISGVSKEVSELKSTSFFLVIGRKETKKNCVRIIEAFSQLSSNTKLVFVGSEGYGYADVAEAIASSQKKEDIIELGFVGEQQKKWLYEHANALVFPSLYEGFGFPAFEALLHRCPVITSKHSPMEEYLSPHVSVVDPLSVPEIYQALLDHESQRKEVDVAFSKTLVSSFSWQSSAASVLSFLE